MSGFWLSCLACINLFNLPESSEMLTLISPILQLRKLELGRIECLAQHHTTQKWQRNDSSHNPGAYALNYVTHHLLV